MPVKDAVTSAGVVLDTVTGTVSRAVPGMSRPLEYTPTYTVWSGSGRQSHVLSRLNGTTTDVRKKPSYAPPKSTVNLPVRYGKHHSNMVQPREDQDVSDGLMP